VHLADQLDDAVGRVDDRLYIDERQREFAGTGMRWLDMRRLFQDPLINLPTPSHPLEGQSFTLKPDRFAMRIPPKVLSANPHMEDNP